MRTTALLLLSLAGTKTLGPEKTAKTLERVGRWLRRTPLRGRRASVASIERRIDDSRTTAPLPIECLEQAMTTWYLLNLKGHAAELKIGMKLSPVMGHAWVESEGATLGQIPGLEDFTVVGSFGAW